jgi:tRNA threonylcarbamoyladenosine biosynthesis protein TsaE
MTISTSPEQTAHIGATLAARLELGDVVLLNGDLGAGKTTLVQGLGRALGISSPLQSPTFTILAEYPARLRGTPITLAHLDLYRLEPGADLYSAGVAEVIEREDGIAVIEWPDRLDGDLDLPTWTIAIEHIGGNSRRITIQEPHRA